LGLGFLRVRVTSIGFQVKGLMVQGVGFRVDGFRIYGLEFRVRVLGNGFQI